MATTPKPPKLNQASADELARTAQAKAGPLPDEPSLNEKALKAVRDTDAGVDVARHESAADMYADLGIESAPGGGGPSSTAATEPAHQARVRAASKSVMGRHGSAFKKLAE